MSNKNNNNNNTTPNKRVRRWFRRHPGEQQAFVPTAAPERHGWANENPGEGGGVWWQRGTVFARDGRSWVTEQVAKVAGHKLVAVAGGWQSVKIEKSSAGIRRADFPRA